MDEEILESINEEVLSELVEYYIKYISTIYIN